MADIGQIKLPDNTVYNIKDENALPLTGGQVTGPVTFGDSVSMDDLTAGNVIITGAFNAIQGIPYSMITGTPTIPSAATAAPIMDGTAAVGSSAKYAKEDHVHPKDTTKADVSTTVTNVSWDSTNRKIQKTINGTTSDVVTLPPREYIGNQQKIPVDYNGTSFSTTITPQNVVEGFTALGATQPSYNNSITTLLYVGSSGATEENRTRFECPMVNRYQSTDGLEFQTATYDLSTIGLTGEVGYLSLLTNGGYNQPYAVELVHWPLSGSDKSIQIPLSSFTYTGAVSGTATSAYNFTQIKNMLDSGIYPWLQIYDQSDESSYIYHPVTYFYDDDIIQFSDPTGRYWATLEETDVSVIHFGESYNGSYAHIISPNFTGTPTAPTQATSDNSTKIATTGFVNNKIDATKKVKYYYVIPDEITAWSGQDYSSYNLGQAFIYIDENGTTLISSTQQLLTDINNGIIPVLKVIDQAGGYVLCYPNWIEDDELIMNFFGVVNHTGRNFVELMVNVDIDSSARSIYFAHYLLNSGLPTVTSSDNGKFLCVVNGAWAATTVPNANGVNF